MISNVSSTSPSLHPDGSLAAVVLSHEAIAPAGTLLRLWLPVAHDAGAGIGRYFLARCAVDSLTDRMLNWSIYARRVLFCASTPTAMLDQTGSAWDFLLPTADDPGYDWLRRQPAGATINLTGPYGQHFNLAPHTRTLAILTDPAQLPLALPLIQLMLDRGGRVALLIRGDNAMVAHLLPFVPIPVEVHFIPPGDWTSHLTTILRWADQFCAILPNQDYAALAYTIRSQRFQLEPAYAQVLVTADIICGVGACLACVVSTRAGSNTRACIHGPLFPLATIAG